MEERSYLGTDTDPVIAPTSDEKTMAVLSHVLTFVAAILAPLIIYLVKKKLLTKIVATSPSLCPYCTPKVI